MTESVGEFDRYIGPLMKLSQGGSLEKSPCSYGRKIRRGKNSDRGMEERKREETIKGRQKFLLLQRKERRRTKGWHEE